MKIATFNTNNVNKRLINLLGWLRRARPDVACLQELKATNSEFPITAIKKAGYDAIWRGEKSWNGVAILGRGDEPVLTRTGLPGDPADTQSRYIEAAVNGVLVATLYAPNGNPQPGPKFKYKLAWIKRLLSHAAELYALDAPVVLAGDFNVVPTDADIYPSKSYAKNALVQHADGKRQYRNKKATMAHRSASNVLNIDHATDVLCQNDAAPLAIHSAWLLLMGSLVLAHFLQVLARAQRPSISVAPLVHRPTSRSRP